MEPTSDENQPIHVSSASQSSDSLDELETLGNHNPFNPDLEDPGVSTSQSLTDIARPSTSTHNDVTPRDVTPRDDVTERVRDVVEGSDAARVCEEFAEKLKGLYPHYLGQVKGSGMAVPLLLHSAAFCDALMKENEKTKTHLNEMREQNEALKRENEELKRDTQCQTQMQTNARTGSSSSPPSGSSDVISRLQARVKKLEGQRTEILRVNRQWDAQYRRLKQEFDTRSAQHEHDETSRTQVKFQAETPSTSASASAGATKQRYEEKRKRDIDVMLMSAKKEIRNLMQEKAAIARNFANAHSQSQTLKRELSQLKEVNRKLETDKSCMEAENQRLNLALEAAYSIHHQRSSLPSDAVLLSNGESNRRNALLDGARYNMLSSSPEEGSPNASGGERSPPPHTAADAGAMDDLRTQIEVLQEQVKIYREDFETERRDREKSQGDKQRLDDQLTRAKHEVQALTQQVRTHEYDFQQERRDKERLKRQLQMLQNRDHGQTGAPPSSRNRDRYHGDANLFVASRTPHDPPAYYAHSRFTGNDETANPYQHRTSNSRRRTRQPAPARQDWRDDNLDIERLLSYPPDVAHDQPNAL